MEAEHESVVVGIGLNVSTRDFSPDLARIAGSLLPGSVSRNRLAAGIKGPSALQPMILRQVAEELGMHESSISRVSRAKYMATPWGTFELKYFFSSALPTDEGTNATSSTAVRALLQQWIAEESPRKPLSDSKLCELLQEQGIQCARRDRKSHV